MLFPAWNAVATLDRMVDDVMGSALGTATHTRTFDPAIDVRTTESDVVIVCDVPGVKADDLQLTLENHVLTIKGTRRFDSRPDEQVMLGRAYGIFSEVFALPEALDENGVSASLADGVLTIRIPRQENARPRKIQIGTNSDVKELTE